LNELPDFAHDQAVHLVVASIRIDTNVRCMYPILHLLFKSRQAPKGLRLVRHFRVAGLSWNGRFKFTALSRTLTTIAG
jgi:hypothetical protein